MPKSGVKFATNPFDVRTCPDRNLLFSSEFRSMPIAIQGSKEMTFDGYNLDQTIAVHSLGYYPVFLTMMVINGKSQFNSGRFSSDQSVSSGGLTFYCTKTDLRVETIWFDGSPATVTIYYYIFLIPLELNIEALNLEDKTTEVGTEKRKSGIIFSQRDESLTDEYPKTKDITTNYPSLIIHKQTYGYYDGSSWLSVPHDLGYPPMFLIFVQNDNTPLDSFTPKSRFDSYNLSLGGFESIGSAATQTDIQAYGLGRCNYSVLILKEKSSV
jgi:hypothetical protein